MKREKWSTHSGVPLVRKTFVNRQRQEERRKKRRILWLAASSPNISAQTQLFTHKWNTYTQSSRLNHSRCFPLLWTGQVAKLAKKAKKNLINSFERKKLVGNKQEIRSKKCLKTSQKNLYYAFKRRVWVRKNWQNDGKTDRKNAKKLELRSCKTILSAQKWDKMTEKTDRKNAKKLELRSWKTILSSQKWDKMTKKMDQKNAKKLELCFWKKILSRQNREKRGKKKRQNWQSTLSKQENRKKMRLSIYGLQISKISDRNQNSRTGRGGFEKEINWTASHE